MAPEDLASMISREAPGIGNSIASIFLCPVFGKLRSARGFDSCDRRVEHGDSPEIVGRHAAIRWLFR